MRYGLTTAYELGTLGDPGPATSHALTIENLDPQDVYELEITAADTSGNDATIAVSATIDLLGSPQLEVFYKGDYRFGQLGQPQRWANILGNVSDPDGIATLTYELNGGPTEPLSIGSDLRRIWYDGDFNVELDFDDLVPGTNQVVIRAVDNQGDVTARVVNFDYIDGGIWPLPYTIDWSTVADLHDVSQPVDGDWELDPVNDGVRSVTPAYDRLLAIGDLAWENYEVTAPITVHSLDLANGLQPPSNILGCGFLLRWTGHTPDNHQPYRDYLPFGAITWYQWGASTNKLRIMLPPGFTGDQIANPTLQLGTRYIFKAQVTNVTVGPDVLPRYRMKYWIDGEAEPAWMLEAFGAASDLSGGSLLLIAHHADATFGDVTIVPIPPE